MKFVLSEIENRIAYITLNRPDKRNALNGDFVEELKIAFSEAENNPEVKVIILRAAGTAFCAGADLQYLQQLQKNTFEENLEDSRNLAELYKQIYLLDKVVIAQVEGHAIAGGAGLASVCDFVFSVPEAKFGYTETAIGFVPAIVSIFLLRKIGEAKAKELLLTAKVISADEAESYGVINFIESKEDIKLATAKLAKHLIEKTSADSLRITKRLISEVQSLDIQTSVELAANTNAEARSTPDCKKGIGAFLNKEKITW